MVFQNVADALKAHGDLKSTKGLLYCMNSFTAVLFILHIIINILCF